MMNTKQLRRFLYDSIREATPETSRRRAKWIVKQLLRMIRE